MRSASNQSRFWFYWKLIQSRFHCHWGTKLSSLIHLEILYLDLEFHLHDAGSELTTLTLCSRKFYLKKFLKLSHWRLPSNINIDIYEWPAIKKKIWIASIEYHCLLSNDISHTFEILEENFCEPKGYARILFCNTKQSVRHPSPMPTLTSSLVFRKNVPMLISMIIS